MKIANQKIITEKELQHLVSCLRSGGIIAFPTETVYALAGDAQNLSAIKQLFKLKNRPLAQPLSVLLAHAQDIEAWAKNVSPLAKRLADYFWPGPLTLIFNKKESILPALTGGGDKIGLRVPDDPCALSILRAFGGGLAAPSANRSAQLSPTQARHVQEAFADELNAIVDGGTCSIGIESTIVDVSTAIPRIVRLGATSQAALQRVINTELVLDAVTHESSRGSLLKQTTADELKKTVCNYLQQGKSVTVLAQQTATMHHSNLAWITMPQEVNAYARVLYQHLHAAKQTASTHVLLEALPQNEAWAGIHALLARYAID